MTGPILMCRYCGADSPRKCDFGEDGVDEDMGERDCPWADSGEYEDDLAEFKERMAEEEDEDDDDGA